MTEHFTYPTNDLILRLAGGQRDGEFINVKTLKCFFGEASSGQSAGAGPHCAIFRGPNGAAVRSYGDGVSINGVSHTVHWLKEGDRIEFPNSMVVEISQLGWVDPSSTPSGDTESFVSESDLKQAAGAEVLDSEPFETETSDFEPGEVEVETPTLELTEREGNRDNINSESVPATNDVGETISDAPQDVPAAIDESIEVRPEFDGASSIAINEMQLQVESTQQRFSKFETQIDEIADQLSIVVPQMDQTSAASVTEESLGAPLNSNAEPKAESVRPGHCLDSQTEAEPSEPTIESSMELEVASYFSQIAKTEEEEVNQTFDATAVTQEEADMSAVESEVIKESPVAPDVQAEVDARLSEIERVFGGDLADPDLGDAESTESTDAEADSSPELNAAIKENEPKDETGDLSALMKSILDQAADEQPLESFKSPTHGQNEDADSSAENTPVDAQPIEPGAFASQLLREVLESDSEQECLNEPAVEETQGNDDTGAATQAELSGSPFDAAVEEEPSGEQPKAKSEPSVADILARMQADGQWNGVPDDDEPVEQIVESTPIIQSPIEPVASEPGGDDVNDYMSQLLNRMRGDGPIKQAEPSEPVAEAISQPKQELDTEEAEFVAPENPLKPEEFKPARQAQKIELSAMRELANSTSRKAVQRSEQVRLQELGYVQIGIAVCSVFMSLYYFFWNSKVLFDTGFFVGFICLGISGFLGFRFYTTMKRNESKIGFGRMRDDLLEKVRSFRDNLIDSKSKLKAKKKANSVSAIEPKPKSK